MRFRVEPFGGLIEHGDDVVAVNRAAMRALGVLESPLWSKAPTRLTAPIIAHVMLSRRCHAGCWYCSVDATADGEEMSLATAVAVIDDLARRQVFTVALGGGEPLLHPCFSEIARHAKSRGLKVTVTTSGVLPDSGHLRTLATLDGVHVSLTPNGVPFLERAAAAGIANLWVNVVVTAHTDLASVAALARRLRLSGVRLLRLRDEGRARNRLPIVVPEPALADVARVFAGIRVLVDDPTGGRAGALICIVGPDGRCR